MDKSKATSISNSPPTQINTWIRFAKDHCTETASDLHMLARDLRILSEDDEALLSSLKKPDTLQNLKIWIIELAKNIECMSVAASQLNTEITDRMGTHKWPEAMTAFRKDIKINKGEEQ